MDTFVPNDVYIAGGAHKLDVNDEQGDDLGEEAPSVVICTGANACGKVCAVLSFLDPTPEIIWCTERLPEAGKSTIVSKRSVYQRRVSQTALIQYMAQV